MNAIVTEARRWIGTPYMHQASSLQAGCDCLGLIRGIWRHLLGPEPATPPNYTADWDEPQGSEVLWQAASAHLTAAGAHWAEGQVLLFRMRRDAVAKHLGILTDISAAPQFVHAYVGHGVVESPLSAPWRRRIVARFEFAKG